MEHANLRLALELCKDVDLTIVKDMASFYERRGSLSENQERFLQMIIDRNQPLDPAWVEEYRSSKREIMARAVAYYTTPSHRDFFGSSVEKFKADPQWVPTIEKFKSMTENKYFVAYEKACSLKPKFQHGELVDCGIFQGIGVVTEVQPPNTAHPSYGYNYQIKSLTDSRIRQYTQNRLRKFKGNKNET